MAKQEPAGPPKNVPLTAKGAATRDRIVQSAADLMYIKGVHATTLDDVLAATGTSKSQLYRHFPDKEALVRAVAGTLEPGGRFAFTVEEGRSLTRPERSRMPAADTVWPVRLKRLTAALRAAGLTVTWQQDCSPAHHAVASALLRCYRADSAQIASQIGEQATAELIRAHQLWSDWLGRGRIRKFAIVAEKPMEPR
jgi:AcrR family transcriptional regulator